MGIKKLNENVKVDNKNVDLVIEELLNRKEMENSTGKTGCTIDEQDEGCVMNNVSKD